MEVVSEAQFAHSLSEALVGIASRAKSVTGLGRSGAIASVYTSHKLGIPYGEACPEALQPILVINTAELSGRTLRKAMRRYSTKLGIAVSK